MEANAVLRHAKPGAHSRGLENADTDATNANLWPYHSFFNSLSSFIDQKNSIILPKIELKVNFQNLKLPKSTHKNSLIMVNFYPCNYFFENNPLYANGVLECIIKSSTNCTKTYNVKLFLEKLVIDSCKDLFYCTCTGFKYSKKHKNCKHTIYLLLSLTKQGAFMRLS